MSARLLLQLLLLVQAAAAGAVAYAAARYIGAGALAGLALGFGAVVLVRALIAANNFRMSMAAASPTPQEFQLGRGAGLMLFGREFLASMAYSSWQGPRARPIQRIFPDAQLAPVLLLHGYGCNSGYWSHLLPMLDAAHISYACPDLAPLGAPIDDYVPAVARAVEALCQASGAAKVVIVGHSMGGLIARAYLRAHGAGRLARIITLGTPHHGTSLANLGPGANARQMRPMADGAGPGNAWLQALAAGEDAQARALITSIYSHHDNIVAPQTSGFLPGAHNIALGGIGHVALGADPRVLSCILHELAREKVFPNSGIVSPPA